VRVWADISVAADVAFFAPLVRRLEQDGHSVTVTARRFAGAAELLRRAGLGAVLTGPVAAGSAGRAAGAAERGRQLAGVVSGGRYGVAVGTHTADFVLAGWTLGLPQLTFLDADEFEGTSRLSLRLADEVAVSDVLTREALTACRPAPRRFVRYPGLREEYSLRDAEVGFGAASRLGLVPGEVLALVAVPPAGSSAEPAAADDERRLIAAAHELAGRPGLAVAALVHGPAQRRELPDAVAEDADPVALIAAADVVVAADAPTLRLAAALGTPAWRVSRRPPGVVERALLQAGRLQTALSAADVGLHKKPLVSLAPPARDPRIFVAELLDLSQSRRKRTGRTPPAGRTSPPA
jgi:predicted glycosyltransferase